MNDVKRDKLKQHIWECSGVIARIARKWGVSRPTVYDRLKKYNLTDEVVNARIRLAEEGLDQLAGRIASGDDAASKYILDLMAKQVFPLEENTTTAIPRLEDLEHD